MNNFWLIHYRKGNNDAFNGKSEAGILYMYGNNVRIIITLK